MFSSHSQRDRGNNVRVGLLDESGNRIPTCEVVDGDTNEPFLSGALSIWSKPTSGIRRKPFGTDFGRAAVRVVLPWST